MNKKADSLVGYSFIRYRKVRERELFRAQTSHG